MKHTASEENKSRLELFVQPEQFGRAMFSHNLVALN